MLKHRAAHYRAGECDLLALKLIAFDSEWESLSELEITYMKHSRHFKPLLPGQTVRNVKGPKPWSADYLDDVPAIEE
jgi:hypothetical protein